MNFKQELNVYLDLFLGNAKKLTFAEYDGNAFYGNQGLLINQELQNHEETLPMLESLDPESVSQKLEDVMKTVCHEEIHTLDDFSRYQAVGTAETVALRRKGISIKKLKLIKKILADKKDITIKTGDMIVFYVGATPMIISSFTMLDMQTSLLPDDPSKASAHVESELKKKSEEKKSIADIVEEGGLVAGAAEVAKSKI